MKALIDGDILSYEIGFAAECGSREGQVPPFAYAQKLLEQKIDYLLAETSASDPIIYLTGENNFRFEIAKRVPYKSRPSHKPFHYTNLRVHMKGAYQAIVVDGMEADDIMAIEQTKALKEGRSTIIVTRDKDLKQVPGWHYSWEVGKQPSWGPKFIEEHPGTLELVQAGKTKKLKGTGIGWFYAQVLIGDTVDTIPGLPGVGPVKAYKVLEGYKHEEDLYCRVLEEYSNEFKGRAEEELLEQGRLLWMCRELDEQGKPKMWELLK